MTPDNFIAGLIDAAILDFSLLEHKQYPLPQAEQGLCPVHLSSASAGLPAVFSPFAWEYCLTGPVPTSWIVL